MELTKVTTKLTSLQDSRKSYESLFLVDTGATDSMAPSDELDKLGIKPEGKRSYELADGTVREFPFGLVRIEFMGETTAGRTSVVVFTRFHPLREDSTTQSTLRWTQRSAEADSLCGLCGTFVSSALNLAVWPSDCGSAVGRQPTA